jgi:hypothetical protein
LTHLGSSSLRFAGAATLTLVAIAAAGAWPTHAWAGPAGLAALGWAAGIALAGALLGFAVGAAASGDGSFEARAQAALIALGVRMFATLAGTLAVLVGGVVAARTPFAVWVAVFYLALLALETAVLVREARRAGRGRAAAA